MADAAHIKEKFERNERTVRLRPARGRYTSTTRVKVRDGLTCDIEDGAWRLVADMGKGSGGEEEGPTPGTYGRAALGSCLAIGYMMWAARLDVPLDGVEVEVQSDADAAGAYAVTDVPAGYSEVRCAITVESAAPEDDVRRVIETADSHSIYYDVFTRAIDVRREIRVVAPRR